MILIPASIGEIVDKMTILRIKQEKLDPDKVKNVEKELFALMELLETGLHPEVIDMITPYSQELAQINKQLWDVEDNLRNLDESITEIAAMMEREGYLDGEEEFENTCKFIKLAQSVYNLNDKRAEVKRIINQISGSELIEEKSYAKYKRTNK